MHQISQVYSWHEGNVDTARWWEANERFLLHCLPLRSLSCSHRPTHLVPTDNKASELKQLLNCFLFNVKGIYPC